MGGCCPRTLGRSTSPSDEVLEALARALLLDEAERGHLVTLAHSTPRGASHERRQSVRRELREILDTLDSTPAFVLGRRTDVLASNYLMRALTTDWNTLPKRRRNYIRWLFLDPAAKTRPTDWRAVAKDVVGTLRLDAGRHPHDPLLGALIGELSQHSTEFAEWWTAHGVHERTQGNKHFHHPVVGSITIHCESFILTTDPDQTLFRYHAAPGSPSATRLTRLRGFGDAP